MERTKTPFDVFALTEAGTRVVQETDTERLNQLVEQLGTVTEDKRADVERLVDGLARVSTAISDRQDQLATLLERLDEISGTLAEKDQVLVRLIDQSAGVLRVLQENRPELESGLRSTDALTGQLASLVAQHKARLDAILETLHPTVKILDDRRADLDRALSWLGPGALGLAQAVNHGPWADVYNVVGTPAP